MSKLIALDWDGVLIDHPPAIGFDEILTYEPMPWAVKSINYLVSKGFEFYVLTARNDEDIPKIREWMVKHGFPEMEVTNIKKNAVCYIDDRAIRFTNWQDISKYFQ